MPLEGGSGSLRVSADDIDQLIDDLRDRLDAARLKEFSNRRRDAPRLQVTHFPPARPHYPPNHTNPRYS